MEEPVLKQCLHSPQVDALFVRSAGEDYPVYVRGGRFGYRRQQRLARHAPGDVDVEYLVFSPSEGYEIEVGLRVRD
ncbi:hypothetical protein SDC9_169460 [bioreactor metagenome]|uniref:Uncharacterized protein n=1 Tax=bioreactor metagenome TaxID=1076179 RepID=A0A645G594_9ZZZZ